MNRVFGLDQHIVGCHIPMFPVLVANDSGTKFKLTRKEQAEQSVDTTRNPHGYNCRAIVKGRISEKYSPSKWVPLWLSSPILCALLMCQMPTPQQVMSRLICNAEIKTMELANSDYMLARSAVKIAVTIGECDS